MAKKIRDIVNEYIERFRMKSPKCEELEMLAQIIENNIQLCEAITSEGSKVSIEQLETLKKEINQGLTNDSGYKNEMKPHIEKLGKEGKELLG